MAFSALEFRTKYLFRDIVLIMLGVLSAGFGLRGFLLPNHFLDGGVMGLSILASFVSHIRMEYFFTLFNAPFIFAGYKRNSYPFLFKATLAIGGLSLAIALMPEMNITDDKLLVAIFGGFFIGAGIGLAIRGGAVIDGTEVLAIYLSRKTPFSVGDVITGINILVFGAGALLINYEVAMYAMLTYLSAAKTADFILHGIEENTTLIIISNQSELLRKLITVGMGKGVTILKGEKGYQRNPGFEELNVLLTVTTRLEISRLREEIEAADPEAFIIQFGVDDTKGGRISRRYNA